MKANKFWVIGLIAFGSIFLFWTVGTLKAEAATRYVSAGSGNNAGDCQVSYCKTLTYAVSQAVSGDTIDVSWGTYDTALGESYPITISKNLTVQGAGAASTTIVGVVVDSAAVHIRGFKIAGGVLYREGSGTIDHNEITNNTGDGIYSDRSETTIHTNLLRGNRDYGIQNYARNNRIYNNTVIENGWGGNGGGIIALTSNPIIKNNIIVSNTGYGIESYYSSGPPNDYNDVWNNSLAEYSPGVSPGSHSLSVDPLFASSSDLRPKCGPVSPVINKGDNSEVGSQTTDLGDNPRIVGDVVDIGAYEAICSRYVSDSGSNTGYCVNVSAPCKTIGYAVSQAIPGDTISVGFGLYDQTLGETFPINIDKKVYLTGFGARWTIVDASGSNQHVFSVINSPANISGFRITGGLHGIRYENSGSGTLTKNILTVNGWHGIHSLNSSPRITNNVLSANGWSGIGIDGTAPAAIVSNTIDGNLFHGIHIGEASGVSLYNNIISYNNHYGIYRFNPELGLNEDFNLYWRNLLGYMGPATQVVIHSKFADPRYYFYTDYHLECGSAAINNGTNSPPGGLPATDIEGQPRIFDGMVDMGAYERQGLCRFIYLPVVNR